MKYYANILNPFSPLVSRKLEEIGGLNLDIDIIAPSHGVIWRDNPVQIIEKYSAWADDYQEDQITIVYDSMWEATTALANAISSEISALSPETRVKVMSISKYDKNEIMTEVFKSKAIAVGSPTVGNDMLSSVSGWLAFLKSLKFKNKKAAAFGSYGWSGESVKKIEEMLVESGFELVDASLRVNWTPTQENLAEAKAVAEALLG